MRVILLFLLLTGAVTAQAAQTVTAQVNGMVCAFCAQGIAKKARALPQAEDVYVNLKQKIVAVQVKEGAILAPAVLSALVKDAGYDAVRVETIDDTVAAIRARAEHP
jgi:periplasmic mercuric ion binding protein